MGTFIDTYGTPSIPKDKLPEFRARTLAIAEQGGMMTLSHITMFGRHLTLLKPVEAGKYACIDFKTNILQFPALTLCNSANGGKALIFRRFRHLPFGRVLRISWRIPA